MMVHGMRREGDVRTDLSSCRDLRPCSAVALTATLEHMRKTESGSAGGRSSEMTSFFKLMAAGPAFFVSAWLLMIFVGVLSADVGIHAIPYTTSMLATIALWLTVAPAIGAVARGNRGPRASA